MQPEAGSDNEWWNLKQNTETLTVISMGSRDFRRHEPQSNDDWNGRNEELVHSIYSPP